MPSFFDIKGQTHFCGTMPDTIMILETVVFGDVQYDEGIEGFSFVCDEQVLDHLQRVRDSFVSCLEQETSSKCSSRLRRVSDSRFESSLRREALPLSFS